MPVTRINSFLKAKSIYYRQLALMLAAGVPVIEAVETTRQGAIHPKLNDINATIAGDLSRGVPVPAAVEKHPALFPRVLVDAFGKTEKGPAIARILHAHADAAEKNALIGDKLLQALFYPAKVFLLALLVFAMVVTFVVPVFEDLYGSFHTNLPIPTQHVMAFGLFMKAYWPLVLAGLVCLVILVAWNRRLRWGLLSWLPFVRRSRHHLMLASFFRNLALLLETELPLPQAVRSAAHSLTDGKTADKLAAIAETITDTGTLKERMEASGFFPPLAIQMVSVGEKSGNMPAGLSQLAAYYDALADKDLCRLTDTTATGTLLILGLLIGYLVFSLYLPIFQVASIVF